MCSRIQPFFATSQSKLPPAWVALTGSCGVSLLLALPLSVLATAARVILLECRSGFAIPQLGTLQQLPFHAEEKPKPLQWPTRKPASSYLPGRISSTPHPRLHSHRILLWILAPAVPAAGNAFSLEFRPVRSLISLRPNLSYLKLQTTPPHYSALLPFFPHCRYDFLIGYIIYLHGLFIV